jgi:Transglycosylase SLT domain
MIRKLIFGIITVSMALGLLLAQVVSEPGPRPTHIMAGAQTQDSIQSEFRRETQEKIFRAEVVIARSVYRRHGCSGSLAELTAENAMRRGLPARLVAAVVVVESTCRAQVVSGEGAVGLMQVSPLVWRVPKSRLKDPAFNLSKGTEILANFVRPYGIREGLHHYNGMGVGCSACDLGYVDKVLGVAGMRT